MFDFNILLDIALSTIPEKIVGGGQGIGSLILFRPNKGLGGLLTAAAELLCFESGTYS